MSIKFCKCYHRQQIQKENCLWFHFSTYCFKYYLAFIKTKFKKKVSRLNFKLINQKISILEKKILIKLLVYKSSMISWGYTLLSVKYLKNLSCWKMVFSFNSTQICGKFVWWSHLYTPSYVIKFHLKLMIIILKLYK